MREGLVTNILEQKERQKMRMESDVIEKSTRQPNLFFKCIHEQESEKKQYKTTGEGKMYNDEGER